MYLVVFFLWCFSTFWAEVIGITHIEFQVYRVAPQIFKQITTMCVCLIIITDHT